MVTYNSIPVVSLKLGQRVRCSLHYCGTGTVVAVKGGGTQANITIVWDNGSCAKVQASLVLSGVQWTVFDDVVSAQEVAAAIELADETSKNLITAKACQDNAYEAEKTALMHKAEFSKLKRSDLSDEYTTKIASKNLRKLLKKQFPNVKFSVRMKHCSTLYVSWLDGPLKRDVDAIARRFKRGQFDGMSDCYEYRRNAFADLFGDADYIFLDREVSNELLAKAIDLVWEKYAGNVRVLEKPTPEGILSGKFSLIDVPGICEPVARLVRIQAAELADNI